MYRTAVFLRLASSCLCGSAAQGFLLYRKLRLWNWKLHVSVVFVSADEGKIKLKLKELQEKNPEKFYMEYAVPFDIDLTSLDHYPSIEISKDDLQ